MEFKKGDIVMVTGTDSVPLNFLGRIGIVNKDCTTYKVSVMFTVGLRGNGDLIHLVLPRELIVIGHTIV